VVVADGTLYGAGYDRRIVAVELATGRVRQVYRMPGGVSAGVALGGDTIYSASDRPDGSVAAVRTTDGRQLWKRRIGFTAQPILLAGDLVVAGPRQGGVVALDRMTGQVKWRRRLAAIQARPVVQGDTLLVLTPDSIFRLSLTDGTLLGGVRAPGPVSAPWTVTESLLLIPTGDGRLGAVGRHDLAPRWSAALDGPPLVSAAVAGDTAWVVTQPGTLFAVPLAAPTARTVAGLGRPISAPPAVWNGLVLLGGADGTLLAIRPDGSTAWTLAVGRPLMEPPVALGPDLLVLGGRGDVHRFAPTGGGR
jgi:outer membrane protein assembly factor BamB